MKEPCLFRINLAHLITDGFSFVDYIQQMLSSLGIPSYYTVNKLHDVEFENGIYECKQSYDVNIGTAAGRKQFINLIGFIQKYKQEKALASLECESSAKRVKITYEIVEKESLGEERVYDITVEADEHTYWTGGLLVSNCGEIGMGVDSCRLLLINLFSFVELPFTDKPSFNFNKFEGFVIKAQLLMDDIIKNNLISNNRQLSTPI